MAEEWFPPRGAVHQAHIWKRLAQSGRHPLRALKTVASCALLLGGRNGYLSATGWFRSMLANSPVGPTGEPIPWITYPCLSFLSSRVRPEMVVFEFGAGSSTLWWASRVERLVSCEHDLAWFQKVRAQVSRNVEMIHAAREGDRYSAEILGYPAEFSIIVIDGRDRVKCAMNSLQALRDDGVILWDNSDRDDYQPGLRFLQQRGFRRLDFTGIAPLILFESTTSLFYREGNCLGL